MYCDCKYKGGSISAEAKSWIWKHFPSIILPRKNEYETAIQREDHVWQGRKGKRGKSKTGRARIIIFVHTGSQKLFSA